MISSSTPFNNYLFFFVLHICLLDIVLTMWGEILSQLLMVSKLWCLGMCWLCKNHLNPKMHDYTIDFHLFLRVHYACVGISMRANNWWGNFSVDSPWHDKIVLKMKTLNHTWLKLNFRWKVGFYMHHYCFFYIHQSWCWTIRRNKAMQWTGFANLP